MKPSLQILAFIASATFSSAASPVIPVTKGSTVIPRQFGAQARTSLRNLSSSNHATSADPRAARFTGASGAGMRNGRDVAGALKDVNGIRSGLPAGAKEFGIRGTTPQKPGFDVPNFGDESFHGSSGDRGDHHPLDRFKAPRGGVKDLRAAVYGSRRAGDGDTDGSWNLGPHEYMNSDGSRHTVTSDGRGQSSTQHYNPDGKYAGRTDSQSSPDFGRATAQHYDNEGHHTSTVVVERRSDGTERKTVYREGQEPEVTHSDDSAPAKAGARSTDRNPSEGASLGGPAGPKVGDVIGLKPIDLLRQYAEGEQTVHRVAPRTREQMSGNQVCPVGESGRTQGPDRVTRINTLHPTGGGDTLNDDNDRPN